MFGSNDTSAVVDSYDRVTTQLKNKINPFLLFYYCIAHKTNMVAYDASKASNCNIIFSEVDTLLNAIASFFDKSNKHKHVLTTL